MLHDSNQSCQHHGCGMNEKAPVYIETGVERSKDGRMDRSVAERKTDR
jgi:hypothetical protein